MIHDQAFKEDHVDTLCKYLAYLITNCLVFNLRVFYDGYRFYVEDEDDIKFLHQEIENYYQLVLRKIHQLDDEIPEFQNWSYALNLSKIF